MTELVWNDGMSVGIDAIDDDHKKLIAILAQLMSARHASLASQDVAKIFQQLELYTQLHFSREEALLAEVDYEDIVEHKKSHQQFIDKIPQLKQQWLATQPNPNKTHEFPFHSNADAEKVQGNIIDFLQRWLVNHILEEDLNYVPALRRNKKHIKYQSVQEYKFPLLRYFSKKLSYYFSLRRRVFITTLLPVIAVFVLSLFYLNNNYQRYQKMNLALSVNTMIGQVNNIVHSLQSERGLSSGYASSNYQHFIKELKQRRMLTDQKIASFLRLLKNNTLTIMNENTAGYDVEVQKILANLPPQRKQIDQQLVSFEQIYRMYTKRIEQLISLAERLTLVEIDTGYINDISTINSLLLFKELTGQIRAIGLNMLDNSQENIYENVEVTMLIGRQINALRAFSHSANKRQKLYCVNLCSAKFQQQLVEMYYLDALSLTNHGEKSAKWFEAMSAHIDGIKIISDILITDYNKKLSNETVRLENKYYLILFVLSLFILAALFFSLVLSYSIISPIRKLTYALNDMSVGQNNLHFTAINGHDEISEMQRAYEKLRRKLLQGDIYKATVSEQQKEIKYRKSQQDHFQHLALTDALTGAVNRLHFNDVLGKEIINVNHHGRPLSIMVLDIDHFKQINDNYGHGVGDDVLVMFYRTCKDAVRGSDVVARIGGEEFVIVMPNTSLINAKNFAERLREKIEQLQIKVDEHDISLTVSIGVSQWRAEQFISAETFFDHADKSLYLAKNTGRNRVVAS